MPNGGVGIVDAIRREVGVDGSIAQATMGGVDLMGGVQVPRRLGGGYLFWSSAALYHSRTFTGPLEAVSAIPTNAIGVVFGHDSLLLFTPDNPPRALALNSRARISLSPPGVVDIAGADDLRVVALDAVGRPLASTDGGQHFRDVSATLNGRASGVLEDGARVGFRLDRDRAAWLGTDGQFVTEPFAAWKPPRATAESNLERLARAASRGVELTGHRALVGEGNGVRAVALDSGAPEALKLIGSEGSHCEPLSAVDDGVASCATYTNQGSQLRIVSRVLTQEPRTEKTFELAEVARYGAAGRVVVEAACSGAKADGVACVRDSGGVWREADVRPLLAGRRLLFWLLGDASAIAAVAVNDADGRVALLDASKGNATVWDKTATEIQGFATPSLRATSFRLMRDGSVRGFLPNGALRVSAAGVVELPQRKFSALGSFGDHALGRDAQGRVWQITNDEMEWQEVLAPPEVAATTADSPRNARQPLSCTLLGCTLEHATGAGQWLRIGWPVTPPAPLRQAVSQPALSPPPPAPALPRTPRPELRCQRIGGQNAAPTPPATKAAPGRELAYYDSFHGRGVRSNVNRSLRATLQIGGPTANEETTFADLVAARATAKVRYREPFSPGGDEHAFKTSIARWIVGKGEREGGDASSRPVLSARPGAADGVLLAGPPFSLWIDSRGKTTPVRPECRVPTAYVDAQGNLFLACASSSGATRLEDANGQTLFRYRPSQFARDSRREGMRFFAPGEATFDTPDVIAVGPDGKLALLRASSGTEPATRDNPAWLLTESGTPLALAPWETLELANSPACAQQVGAYRAVLQTSTAWINLDGAQLAPDAQANMWALVRWNAERVCLEAVELGSTVRAERLVASFVGTSPGAALSNPRLPWPKPDAATCTFVPAKAEPQR